MQVALETAPFLVLSTGVLCERWYNHREESLAPIPPPLPPRPGRSGERPREMVESPPIIPSSDDTHTNNADLIPDASLKRNIIEYLNYQLRLQFDNARLAAAQGLTAAQRKLDDTEKEYQAGIDEAKKAADEAYKTWEKKRGEVTGSYKPTIVGYDAEVKKLQGVIDVTRSNFDSGVAGSKQAVLKVHSNRAAAMKNAEEAAEIAERHMNSAIQGAQAEVDKAAGRMHRVLGSAHERVKDARCTVQGLQTQIDALHTAIRENEQVPWFDFGKKATIPGLYVAVRGVEASKVVAERVLRAAEKILNSAEHVSGETAAGTAKSGLDGARKHGPATLDLAKDALNATDAATRGAIERAEKLLQDTRTGTSNVILRGAEGSLETYKQAKETAFRQAVAQIDNVARCMEFLSYKASLLALETAKHATMPLHAAKSTLEAAKISSDVSSTTAGWIRDHDTHFFEIQSIDLSREPPEITSQMPGGLEGEQPPIMADVQGTFFGDAFRFACEYDPQDPEALVNSVYQRLWDDAEGRVRSRETQESD